MSCKRVSMITGIVLIGAISWATVAAASPPYVYAAWKKITTSEAECLQRAAIVLSNNGFADARTIDNDAVIGFLGDYSALVRCAAGDPGIAMMFVAGPADTGLNYVTVIWNAF